MKTKIYFEAVLDKDDIEENDSGQSLSFSFFDENCPFFIEFGSIDEYEEGEDGEDGLNDESKHIEFKKLIGKKIKITVEEL